MKILIGSLILLFAITSGFAQEKKTATPYLYPYDAVLINKISAEHPELAPKYVLYEENLKSIINEMKAAEGQNAPKTDTLLSGKRVIPVVFHIVHNGGAENISKEQIEDAINRINIDYNKLNADTGAGYTYPAFDALRADCKIEFRLAKIDPSGNCTDGIVRHYDPQTNYAYFKTMSDFCWAPSRYMNIFTVNFIYPEGMALPDGAFIGGMSPFPPSNTLTQALTGGDTLADGVLIRHDCIGSIGTAVSMGGMPINGLNRTFTHESGHYFNLYHPFQAGPLCVLFAGGDGCGASFWGCGDEVTDTPPVHAASQNTSINCYTPGSINSCTNDSPDLPDMVENYMDYQWGYCTNMFSLGQLDRINAAMQTDRRKLWSKENLILTGVLDTNASVCAPIAEFVSASGLVCSGGTIQFTDYSYSGVAQNWLWTFEGGSPATSTDQNPLITYNAPGTYYIKLMVSNAYGADSLMKQDIITVKSITAATPTPFVENFEAVTLNNGWIVKNDVGNPWTITDTASYSTSKSIRLKNYSGNNAGSFDEFITPAYDFTGLPAGGTPFVKFKLAYAGKIVPGTILTPADTAFDAIKMYVSKDCGTTWSEKYAESGLALGSANATASSFAPASPAEWKEISRPLPGFLTENNVMFKFVFHANGGNNIYIDDINLTSSLAGFEENMMETLHFTVQPNPVTGVSIIQFNLEVPAKVKISVYDILGSEINSLVSGRLEAGNHTVELNKSTLGSSGMYFVKAMFDGNTLVKKIVVQ